MKTKKEAIEKKVSQVLEIFSFENMQRKYPDFCLCCKKNKPCHDMENMNCFFCFCPEYDNSKEEGGCKRNSEKGKWFVNENLAKGKIWDCSDCDYPHRKENCEIILNKIFKGESL